MDSLPPTKRNTIKLHAEERTSLIEGLEEPISSGERARENISQRWIGSDKFREPDGGKLREYTSHSHARTGMAVPPGSEKVRNELLSYLQECGMEKKRTPKSMKSRQKRTLPSGWTDLWDDDDSSTDSRPGTAPNAKCGGKKSAKTPSTSDCKNMNRLPAKSVIQRHNSMPAETFKQVQPPRFEGDEEVRRKLDQFKFLQRDLRSELSLFRDEELSLLSQYHSPSCRAFNPVHETAQSYETKGVLHTVLGHPGMSSGPAHGTRASVAARTTMKAEPEEASRDRADTEDMVGSLHRFIELGSKKSAKKLNTRATLKRPSAVLGAMRGRSLLDSEATREALGVKSAWLDTDSQSSADFLPLETSVSTSASQSCRPSSRKLHALADKAKKADSSSMLQRMAVFANVSVLTGTSFREPEEPDAAYY